MPKKHKDNDDRRSKRSNTYDPFKDDPFFNQTTEDLPILANGLTPHNPVSMATTDNDNGYSYTSSSVMSYSKVGDQQPQVYQASKSLRRDGDLTEEKRLLRDTKRKVDKREMDRNIGNKGHRLLVVRDLERNNLDRNEDFRGFEEDQLDEFNQDWNNHRSNKREIHQQSLGRSQNLDIEKYKDKKRSKRD